MNSEFQNLIAYLQTYFEEDIVAALLRQRKKDFTKTMPEKILKRRKSGT